MATNAPSRHAAIAHDDTDGERFIETLHPWRRRLWVQQILSWTEYGVTIGIICICFLLLISRFIPWATASYWAFGIAIVILLCAMGAALWYRPSFARSAHYIDTQLLLHDRLSTAWELRDNSAPISVLQRRDALRQLSKHSPSATISLWPGRIRLFTFGIAAIALVLLLLIPNPMNAVLQQQAAFQVRLNRQIAAINQARTVIDNQAAISAQERALIDKILREALARLQQSSSEEQAQQSLAQAQSKLSQLRDPQASQKAQARANASSSLQNSSNANVSNTGKALATGDNKALASSLQNLASQLNNMTPAESAAAQDSANQATTDSIDQASQSLQNAANAIASTTDSSNSQNSSQSQTPGQGQSPGQTKASGQGQGISGQGGQNNTNNNSGKNEQVFVPGQVGSGTSNISVDGSTGTVQSGKPVPYSQVIAQYSQMAHDAINNSNIPPDLKNLIQDYFNSLEGRQ